MPLSEEDVARIAAAIKAHNCPLTEPETHEKHERHHNYIDVIIQHKNKHTTIHHTIIKKNLTNLI